MRYDSYASRNEAMLEKRLVGRDVSGVVSVKEEKYT